MKSFRDIRVLPVVLVAIFGLAVLKIAGLVLDGGYVFDYQPNKQKMSWAQENLGFPGAPKIDSDEIITGSTHGAPKEEKKDEAPETAGRRHEPPKPGGTVVFPDQNPQSVSPSERAILERLQTRRQELEQRAREVEIRERLLKSAEKRIEGRGG